MTLLENLIVYMGDVSNPRVFSRSRHKLIDIIVIGVLAIICHAESWYEIEEFGYAKESWLRKYLELPNGIPSHDTFVRVFGLINPVEFEICFMSWVGEVREKIHGDTICIDGKTSRGTMKQRDGHWRDCLHTVTWFTMSGMVLGQLKADGPGNSEVSAAKDLIDLLDIEGLTIVGDAGIGRESLIKKIREKKGDYLFPIKGNAGGFLAKVEDVFDKCLSKKTRPKSLDVFSHESKGHGRTETRSTTIIKKTGLPKNLNINQDGSIRFEDLNVIGKIVYESIEKENRPSHNRRMDEKKAPDGKRIKTEIRYFVSNLKGDAEFFTEKIRLQWDIENKLHWILDVGLGEDGNRTRNKVAAENLATVRKIAVNPVKQDKTDKRSVRRKIKLAGWDENYLEKILFQKNLS